VGKQQVSKLAVEVDELRRIAVGLRQISENLRWMDGLEGVLAEVGADVGSHRVHRGVALVTEATFRLISAISSELETTAWLADSAANAYRMVESSVVPS
jgi:hypothetical protein